MSNLSLHFLCCLGEVRVDISKLMAQQCCWEHRELSGAGAEVCSCCKMGLKQKPVGLQF